MDSLPDISKILGIIMENPEIIEKIKNLSLKESAASAPTVAVGEIEDANETPAEEKSESDTATPVYAPQSIRTNKKRRHDLLCAIKPYVSDGRGKAIDTMLSVIDVLDIIKAR